MRALAGCCLSLTLVATAACASREWVEDLAAERDAAIHQAIDRKVVRAEATAATAVAAAAEAYGRLERDHAEREQRDQERREALDVRLTAIERTAAEARETSRLARIRADEALARTQDADSRLSRLWANRHAREPVNRLAITFGFDDSSLDDAGKSTLLALAHELRDNPTLTVDLEGYSDSKGPRDYNLRLSRRRVEAVQRYLEELGVHPRRIHAIARGPLNDPGMTDERKRRVVVTIMLDVE